MFTLIFKFRSFSCSELNQRDHLRLGTAVNFSHETEQLKQTLRSYYKLSKDHPDEILKVCLKGDRIGIFIL